MSASQDWSKFNWKWFKEPGKTLDDALTQALQGKLQDGIDPVWNRSGCSRNVRWSEFNTRKKKWRLTRSQKIQRVLHQMKQSRWEVIFNRENQEENNSNNSRTVLTELQKIIRTS